MELHQVSEEAVTRLLESRAEFMRFLKRRVPTPEIAEDLLQSALLKSIEKGTEIRDSDRMTAWFYRVLRNAVVDYYRESGRDPQELRGVLTDLEAFAAAAPESSAEICRCIHPLLDNLKAEYREALSTIDLGTGQLADLAGRAGITEGNAAVRLHRARRAMRRQVEMACGACAEHHCVDCQCRHP